MTDRGRSRTKYGALATLFFFTLSSCASFYHFRALSFPDPHELKIVQTVPGTKITIGLRSYHTAQSIHDLFGHQGLWREHILPLLLVVSENGTEKAIINPHSLYLSILNNRYRNISPDEAFDIAWQASVPYQTIKQTLYYTGLILFTIVTLGLGSMIWVLPSPFSRPAPAKTPFGRDLSYKAFPLDAAIFPHGKIGGLLYFEIPFNENLLNRTTLSLQVTESALDGKGVPRILNVTIPLHSKEKSKVNPIFEMLHGFF